MHLNSDPSALQTVNLVSQKWHFLSYLLKNYLFFSVYGHGVQVGTPSFSSIIPVSHTISHYGRSFNPVPVTSLNPSLHTILPSGSHYSTNWGHYEHFLAFVFQNLPRTQGVHEANPSLTLYYPVIHSWVQSC